MLTPFRTADSPSRNLRRRDVGTARYVVSVSPEVDVALIRETLALTPQQRIQQSDPRGSRPCLLETNLVPLDVLCAIDGGRDDDALLPNSHRIEIPATRLRSRLGDADRARAWFVGSRNQLVLPVLEETLEQSAG